MRSLFNITLVVVLCVLSGCLFGQKKDTLSVTLSVANVSKPSVTNADQRIFNQEKLVEGGRLLIIPFQAGPNVLVSQELDRLSLFIVKGLADFLINQNSSLVLIDAAEAMSADFVIKGLVTRFKKPKPWKHWIPGQKKKYLDIEARMLDQNDGELILQFKEENLSTSKESDFETMAYELGQDIGRFIVEGQGKVHSQGQP
ncbi:MAG: hypothetical protein ABIJ41_00170 [Candidatus Omnitrophota bacterium]